MAELRLKAWFTLLAILYVKLGYGFNVGEKSGTRVTHRGTLNTMFGYDVALFKNGPDEYNILVGAPKGNSAHQENVVRAGAAYKCSSLLSRCLLVMFDKKGDRTGLNGPGKSVKLESKSDQWFGATITALDTDELGKDAVVVCAPFYKNLQTNQEINIEPVGNCFYANNSFQTIRSFSPCKQTSLTGYHRHGYCMAGFSAALGKDNVAYLGAPGSYYWGGAVLAQSLSFNRNEKPLYTLNGSKDYDDIYMGYSTATGDFNGDHVDDVAVGIPKGNLFTGMVAVYSDQLKSLVNFTGDQFGSYFGHSLAVTDLNKDGLQDIIVGAPFYTGFEKSSTGIKSTYEIGRIYIYFQSNKHTFEKVVAINGQKEWSRFGFDIAAVGDLNQDGFNDFIVGAPYDGKEKRSGAIYIFNGAKDGVREKPSQVIYGQSVQPSIETFGFSVAGGRDVDLNGYPDIIVGAPKSDTAILFKSRPVVKLIGSISLTPKVLNLEHKNCTIRDRSSRTQAKSVHMPCSTVKICVQYSGKQISPDLDMKFTISLDVDKPNEGRAQIVSESGLLSSMTVDALLYEREEFCTNAKIVVDEAIRDKLSPIVIEVNFTVDEANYKRSALSPVVDILQRSLRENLKIARNCGKDDVCIPDLQIVSMSPSSKNIGATEKFNLSFIIRNREEPAYETYLYLHTPKGMDIESYTETKGKIFTCDRQTASKEVPNYDVTKCDLGNPMMGERSLTFSLSTKFFHGPFDDVVLYAKVNSTNNESAHNLGNNEKSVAVNFSVDAQLIVLALNNTGVYNVDGYRDPDKISWDEEIGPLINHTYEVVSKGNSLLSSVAVDIYFPSSTQDDRPLLYIVKDIVIDDMNNRTYCELQQKGNINPKHYGITDYEYDHKLVKRSISDEHTSHHYGFSGKNWLNIHGFSKNKRFNCMDMNCTSWRCNITNLGKDDRVKFIVFARLWTNTMVKEAFYDSTISSVIVARVVKLSMKTPNALALPTEYAIASTTVTANDPSRLSRGLPWWLILVAILAGLALLVLLTLLLWRCGFFKRKRPPRGQALLAKPSEAEFYGYSTYSPANPNYPTHTAVPYGQKL